MGGAGPAGPSQLRISSTTTVAPAAAGAGEAATRAEVQGSPRCPSHVHLNSLLFIFLGLILKGCLVFHVLVCKWGRGSACGHCISLNFCGIHQMFVVINIPTPYKQLESIHRGCSLMLILTLDLWILQHSPVRPYVTWLSNTNSFCIKQAKYGWRTSQTVH